MSENAQQLDAKSIAIMPWLVATAFFMQMLDSTILNTAIPSLARAFNESPLKMQAVIVSYVLTVALLIPISGWLADRFGTRRVFFGAMLLFTVGSLCCALSNSLEKLVISRIVQGIGGANMAPVGRLAVLRAYPRAQLVRVMSLITMPGLIGPLLGPTVGGLLVEYASWHWIFLINIPVGLAGCLLSLRYLPDFKREVRRFDIAGFLLFGFSMIAVSIATVGAQELGLDILLSLGILLGGFALLYFYIRHAGRSDHPLLNIKIFKNIPFRVGLAGNLFSRLGAGAMPFLTPLLLQAGFGFSPAMAGIYMIPMTMASLVSKMVATPLITRFGYRMVLTVNTFLQGMVIAAFSFITPSINTWLLLSILFFFGGVNSTQFTAMNTLTLVELTDNDASDGNALLSIIIQIAAGFGIAFGAGMLEVFSAGQDISGNAQSFAAFRNTYIGMGAVTAATALIFTRTPKNAGGSGPCQKVDGASTH